MRLIDGEALKYAIDRRMDDSTDESFSEGLAEAMIEIDFMPTIEKVKEDDKRRIISDSFARGFNKAKRDIAISGEYERAYERGKNDATLLTTWLNPYCPYKCEHCGHYSDLKTPYCAWCGRRASNYE